MVRFARRNKNRSALSRRRKEQSKNGWGSVASEERSALLADEDPMESDMLDPPDDPAPESSGLDPGEPTQRLLTVLGRFYSQVAKAQDGAPQQDWSDECMNQLIAAVEIALGQGWTSVVKALTETGRILQTYEDAGDAERCAAFLADSYETLCLMVGDLIVGEVRAGVLQKWETLYARALEEVEAAGLTLVEDSEEKVAPNTEAGQDLQTELDTTERGEVSPFDFPPEDEVAIAADEEALPTLDDLPPLTEEEQPAETASELEPAGADAGGEPAGTVVDLDEADASQAETIADDVVEEPVLEELPPLGDLEDAQPEVLDGAPASSKGGAQADEEFLVVAPESARHIRDTLDGFCDKLAQLKDSEDQDRQSVFAALEGDLEFLEHEASKLGRPGAERVCNVMRGVLRAAAQSEIEVAEGFFDLAYAFSGVYAEAGDDAADIAVAAWCDEAETLTETAPEPAPAAAEGPGEPSADPVHALLANAQRLIDEGNVSEAKLLALEAVANIAKIETQRSGAEVEKTETALQESAAAIDEARAAVESAAQELAAAESQVAETRERLGEVQAEGEAIGNSIAEMESAIADLDGQIRQLQDMREEKSDELRQRQAALEAQQESANKTNAELDEGTRAEETCRTHLEDARQNVKTLQRKRSEIDAELAKARDCLTRRQASLENIEQTLAQLRDDSTGQPSDDALLF